MYEVTEDNVANLKISTRMIAREYLSRGATIRTFYSTSGMLQIQLPDHPVAMRVFSVIDESMSFIAGRSIAGNKQVSNALAAQIGIKVPHEMYMSFSDVSQKLIEIQRFINEYGKVVVKPVDGAHGNGVLVGITEANEIVRHAAIIKPSSRFGGFLIQEQLEGIDIRIVCIDGTFMSAMTRLPAYITGDGTHSVEALIDIENQKPERGDNYGTVLNKIDVDHVKGFLTSEQLQIIPTADERIQVAGISNVGVGGIRKNIDDLVPVFLQEMAESIAKELRLPICGVDFFVDKIPSRDDTPTDLNPVLIEVNNCPGITMYESFSDPRQQKLVSTLVDSQITAHKRLYQD